MIEWLLHNKEWIFSGIGVFILGAIGKLLYDRLHPRALPPASGGVHIDLVHHVDTSRTGPAQVMQGGASIVPTTVLEKNTTGTLGDWLNATVRIRIGDYYAIQAGNYHLRIEVTDIRMASIQAEMGLGVKDEFAVELYVSLGGVVVQGGAGTINVTTNKFLVPRFQYDQALRSLYFVSTTEHCSTFLVVSVAHINANDGVADINIVKASISG